MTESAIDPVARLTTFAALDEPLAPRLGVPGLDLNDPDFTTKFHVAAAIDDHAQQACELLRAEIAPDLRAVLRQCADQKWRIGQAEGLAAKALDRLEVHEAARRAAEAKLADMTAEFAEAEDNVPSRITAEMERDDARVERDRLSARLREVRAVTEFWHKAAIEQRDSTNWTIAGHALAGILSAIDGTTHLAADEPGEPDLSNEPLGEIDV